MQAGTECPNCGSAEWYSHGSYTRSDGARVRRVRCKGEHCRTTWILGRAAIVHGMRIGARRKEEKTTYEQFFLRLLERFTEIGLSQAIAEATAEAGVHKSTASRWIRGADIEKTFKGDPCLIGGRRIPRDARFSAERHRLLRECLSLYRRTIRVNLPHHQTRISLLSPEISLAVWATLVQARGMAAIIRGTPFPSWLDYATSHISDDGSQFPVSAWRAMWNDLEGFGRKMRRASAKEPWNDPAAQAWIRMGSQPEGQAQLRKALDRMDGQCRTTAGRRATSDSVDQQSVQRFARDLLQIAPPPVSLDRVQIEHAVQCELRRRHQLHRIRGTREDPNPDRGLRYWLEFVRLGSTATKVGVGVTTRSRLVGLASRVVSEEIRETRLFRLLTNSRSVNEYGTFTFLISAGGPRRSIGVVWPAPDGGPV